MSIRESASSGGKNLSYREIVVEPRLPFAHELLEIRIGKTLDERIALRPKAGMGVGHPGFAPCGDRCQLNADLAYRY